MGVLYMLLSLAVMVPMAFLTEAVVSRLSTELQSSAIDVRDGIDRRRVTEALSNSGFLRVDGASSCQAAMKIGVRELLEGDAAPPSALTKSGLSQRYFFFPDQASAPEAAGFLVRLPENPTRSIGLLAKASNGQCNSGYVAPASSTTSAQSVDFSICRVEDASRLSRVNADWQWTWKADSPDPPDQGDYSLCAQGLLISQKE